MLKSKCWETLFHSRNNFWCFRLLLSNVFNQSSSRGRSKIKRVTSKRRLFRFRAKKNQQLSLITDATKEIKTSRRIFESKFFFYFAIFFSCFFRNFRPKQFSRNTEPIFFSNWARMHPKPKFRDFEVHRKTFFSWLVDNFTWGYRKRVEDRTPTVEKSSKQNCSKSYNTLIIMFLIL